MKSNKSRLLLNAASLLILLCMAVVTVHAATQIPLTGGGTIELAPGSNPPGLSQFIAQVENGSENQIAGLFVKNIFSYPVIQQPGGMPAYVSTQVDTITQFGFASDYGSLGFLAHNNLAGAKFSEIAIGDLVTVVYGDGHIDQYQVAQTRSFQAVQPDNPYTSFIDLSNNQSLTVEDVFYQTYGVSDQLILQTCIASGGNGSWGRLFVIATPYVPVAAKITLPVVAAAAH